MPRSFAAAWLAAEQDARALLPRCGLALEGEAARREVRAAARPEGIDPTLTAALRELDASLPPDPSRRRSIDALAGGAACVVTGQQVGLFLGPLYTLHKAATAIALAERLTKASGHVVVPVFWLQTEDHDLEEVRRVVVTSPDGTAHPLAIADDGRDRVSLAHRLLGDDVREPVARLAELLVEPPNQTAHGAEVLAAIAESHRPGVPLAHAFASLLARVFAGTGLVLLDPRGPAIARLALPLHARALEAQPAIDAALDERRRLLEAAGFAEQVRTRPGCSLAFFHEGPEGHEKYEGHEEEARGANHDVALAPRQRLTRVSPSSGSGAAWRLPSGRVLSPGELRALCEREPLRLSTSALLRPLLEETLLPTVAYVGGPGEIGYFAQTAPLYALLGVRAPLVVPRLRVRLVEPPVRRALDALGIAPSEGERPTDALLALVEARAREGQGASALDADDRFAERLAAAAAALRGVIAEAAIVDGDGPREPSLARAARRTTATIDRAVERLARRHATAALRRDATRLARAQRVTGALFPDGAPQERIHGMPGYAARVGLRPLARLLLDAAAAHLEDARATVRDVQCE